MHGGIMASSVDSGSGEPSTISSPIPYIYLRENTLGKRINPALLLPTIMGK